jgi:membrane protein YqaA with SNARE-associated domain
MLWGLFMLILGSATFLVIFQELAFTAVVVHDRVVIDRASCTCACTKFGQLTQ